MRKKKITISSWHLCLKDKGFRYGKGHVIILKIMVEIVIGRNIKTFDECKRPWLQEVNTNYQFEVLLSLIKKKILKPKP